jgi:hypothetical protein
VRSLSDDADSNDHEPVLMHADDDGGAFDFRASDPWMVSSRALPCLALPCLALPCLAEKKSSLVERNLPPRRCSRAETSTRFRVRSLGRRRRRRRRAFVFAFERTVTVERIGALLFRSIVHRS